MSEFLLKGLVYVPAFFFGKALATAGLDAFLAGWLAAATAVMISVLIWPPRYRAAGQPTR